jgi:hypothetical protein
VAESNGDVTQDTARDASPLPLPYSDRATMPVQEASAVILGDDAFGQVRIVHLTHFGAALRYG